VDFFSILDLLESSDPEGQGDLPSDSYQRKIAANLIIDLEKDSREQGNGVTSKFFN
jgi:hypothetical protein